MLNLNQLIVTLRQVTFMLQTQKDRIRDFGAWYETGWRDRMKADPLMCWLRDARTRVEKHGDLELASTAEVTILASWLDGPSRTMDVSPALGPSDIAASISLDDLPEQVRKEGLLKVERRWVSKDLPDDELTDVCAHGYGVVATILAEAHERLGYQMRTFSGETHEGEHHRVDHLGGRLPCMLTTRDERTAYVRLDSGKLLEEETRDTWFSPGDEERALFEQRSQAMTVGPHALATPPGEDPLDWGNRWSSVARRVLAHDGYHRPLAFLLGREGQPIKCIGLNYEDQTEKYFAMRSVAREADRLGARVVVLISEAWEAQIDIKEFSPTMLRAGERADRTEALSVVVATWDGRYRSYRSPFKRDANNRPILGAQVTVPEGGFPGILEPLLTMWAKWPAS